MRRSVWKGEELVQEILIRSRLEWKGIEGVLVVASHCLQEGIDMVLNGLAKLCWHGVQWHAGGLITVARLCDAVWLK